MKKSSCLYLANINVEKVFLSFLEDMMYCPNCGKELIDNSKFCSNCGFEIIHAQKLQVRNDYEKKMPILRLDFLFCIIVPITLFITNLILGKLISGIDHLFIKEVLNTIINFVIKISFLAGLIFASNEIQKKKNIVSIISIIVSCLYAVYCIITSILSFINFLGNEKKDSFDIFYAISNISDVLFLIIGLVVILLFIFRKKRILNFFAIISFSFVISFSLIYSTVSLIHINKLLDEINSLTSSISKSYNSKGEFGTWTVYLSYDDPDSRYSKYDNRYSRRTRNCYKDYAIQNAKDWLLIEHPRARNIYVDDCFFEGYSTSPID